MQEKVKEMNRSEQRPEVRDARARSVEGLGWRQRLRRLTVELLWGCGAWLLGQAPMLFATYPLGLCLLCASTQHTLPILIGLSLSAFWQSSTPAVYIAVVLATTLVRIASAMLFDLPEVCDLSDRLRARLRRGREETTEETSDEDAARLLQLKARLQTDGAGAARGRVRRFFSERMRLAMVTATVAAFILALIRVIGGGFRYYDLFAAVFVLLITPIAVLVWSVSLSDRTEYRVLHAISRASLLFAIVWAADGVLVSGLPLSVMLAFFFTLLATRRGGYAIGIAAALIAGLSYDPMHAPALVAASLIFSLLCALKRENLGILLAAFAAVAWTSYAKGPTSLLLLLPSVLAAGMAFRLYSLLFSDNGQASEAEEGAVDRQKMEGTRYRDSSERFRGISDAFSSLSEVFYNLSDRFRRPGTLDLRQICDGSFDRFCPDCPNKSICWGLEYSGTLHTVSTLVSALHTKGRVTRAQISSPLAHRCESVDAILDSINSECAKLTGEMLRNNRTEIFAMDYESAASIINDALEEDDGEYRFDHALEQRIAEYLSDAGVRTQSVTVYGMRRRQILVRGVDVEHATVSVETMRADLGEMCGMELSCPIFEIEDNVSLMTFRARKKISVISAESNLSADGGVSGDSINLFSNKKDFFYALICDGMGAGREAALTSGLCSVFLEKMLRAGNRAGTSLRMLNNMIRSRGADSTRECSSTVDLLELDLMTARASFTKSGAAPSFVIRDRVVHRLQAGTAPIGIICALDVQSTPFDLRVGDTVVMISDGILQDDPECEWISGFLADAGTLTPEELVYHICLHAAKNEGHDDCSALAIRICSAEEE